MNQTHNEYPPTNAFPPALTVSPETATQPHPVDPSVLAMLEEIQEPGQPDLVCELIGLFLEDAARNLAAIETAVENRNAAGIRVAAHSLKGSSGSLGATHVADRCRELEGIVPSEGWLDIQQTLRSLKSACTDAVEFFQAELVRRAPCAS
jgi:HPt (histidine-containing phosphotransfer) domain-containing protein